MSAPLHIGLVMQGGAGWMGGSEYIKNLAHALAAAERDTPGRARLSLICGHPLDAQMQREIGIESVITLPPHRRGPLGRWLRAGNRSFARAVRAAAFDFIYPLTYDNEHNIGVSLPLGSGLGFARWAGWIPDFQHRQLPELFGAAEIAKRDRGIAALAASARTIVFSSEASAADYRRFCPEAKARAEVLRFCTAPVPEWLAGDPLAAQAGYHLPDRFFLISNQVWQHKNHLLVFDALGLLAARGIRPHVVCTGQPADFRDRNFINVILQRLHERGVAAQVALLGLVPRATQIQLMRRCLAVVQPSLCEGWSTVVEDARLLGKTVVLSDLEVHREQNPPGARFFDRTSAEALATALAEVWRSGEPGPDRAGEAAATAAASRAQLDFGRRFLDIAAAPDPALLSTLKDRLVIFLHVPKASGSTLNRIIAQQVPPAAIVKVGGKSREAIRAEIAATPGARMLIGHYPFGLHAAPPGPCTYITMLREPVQRFVSHYRFAGKLPGHPLHDAVASGALSLPEAARKMANLQTRYLAGDAAPSTAETADESTLAAAKENLERHFAVVGMTERFDESVVLMQRRLGWKVRAFTSSNVGRDNREGREPNAPDLAVIREHHRLDLALYEWAAARFAREIEAEGAAFQNEVARLQWRNRVLDWTRGLTGGFFRAAVAGENMNETLPKITVVTPSFNQAAFLETTILGVLGQCYPNLEYIIMDGGSTDGSMAIIERYADRLTYWQSQRDGGQSAAINAGFTRATGDILCWVNSDDFYLPGTLLRIGRVLANRAKEPALVYGSCLFFREGAAATAKVLKAKTFNAALLRATDYIVQPSAFWTRALWEKTGTLDESLAFGFDWDWFIRASAHARFDSMEEILSAYRRHADHKSGSGGPRRRDEITAVIRRHADERVVRAYEFTQAHWPAVQRWSRLRRWMERRGAPGASALPQATTPALWTLPSGVTLHDIRIAAGMFEDA